MGVVFLLRRYRCVWPALAIGLFCVASVASAQPIGGSPWEAVASRLAASFTGTLARSLALVAIVIGGLMLMFGEAGAKRQIAGIVFGGGVALFATSFLQWLFP